MELQAYQKAVAIIEQHPDLSDYEGVSDEIILKAETVLGLAFPLTYRNYLLKFGALSFGFIDIYGIVSDDFINSGIPDAVWYTLKLREEDELSLPRHLVAIYHTGGGEIFCLNTSTTDGQVVSFAIGYDLENQTYKVISDSFGEFLLEKVKFVINELK
ncbi:SMI1/KNR4 family protein [Paenibacillus sp. GCM10023252]|uniref:SMI1/KNR4 family protein n=1 Tax=Paenibacillus sp. GCM10023252 TaxID=3252649 RepID=UPI003607F796